MTKNFRLQSLLERSPLSEEVKHNIVVIFEVLSFERQRQILDHWDTYILRFLEVQQHAEEKLIQEFREALPVINTLLDESRKRSEEAEQYKEQSKKETREQLESTVAYGQLQNLKKIKSISQIPV